MNESPGIAKEAKVESVPLWRRVIAFPLVALLLGLLAIGLVKIPLGVITFGYVRVMGIEQIRDVPDWFTSSLRLVSVVGYVLTVKLAIGRLGAERRDDLPFDGRSRDLLSGIVFATLLLSLIVGIAALLGGYRVSGWGGSTSLLWLVVAAGINAGFFEEIVFRGIVFRFLEEFAGSWIALFLSALMFGWIHRFNPNATLFTTLAIALEAGVLFGGAYMWTRNLWFAIGLHAGWNFAQGYIWDVPVSGVPVDGLLQSHPAGNPLISGGAFGMEGSVIAVVLVTGAGIWFIAKAVRLGRIVQPWWVRRNEGLPLPASTGRLTLGLSLHP